ncbi:MAG: peptidase M16 [Deltaproteobacteria bacterium]|nr:peptidase M16 [Deltaproteobacteria bacterium]
MSKHEHGFELVEERQIKEIHSLARLYRHFKTGARVLSVQNDDPNKVFGITFRTPPKDSTGVAHILEHSVLCGSRRYPVKEPFVELLKGSLQTFLNAFTYPDRTCYPVASLNERDFRNLTDVYLDAVFHPRITPEIFRQEGWRYELDGEGKALSMQGVVFNEMKGVYSSAPSLLGETCQRSLFPDTLYGLDSGGDPEVIPTLTYEDFKRFHETYYHPSNSWIFFYGDDDPDERLKLLVEYLDEFEALAVDSNIPLQSPIPCPVRVVRPYPAGEEQGEPKSMACLNWLLPEIVEAEVGLAWGVLGYLLVAMPGSPLRRALIESGLGEDLVGEGLETDLRQMSFSTGLSGVRPGDEDKVHDLILDTLTRVAREGFEPELVEAALNRMEFALRENNTGSAPRGLVVMLRAMKAWIYDRGPFLFLEFEPALERLKSRLASGEPVFRDLVARYLLDNEHRSFVVMEPDTAFETLRAARDRERLDAVLQGMTLEVLEAVKDEQARLKAFQETPDRPEDLARIPFLKRSDINPAIRTVPHEILHLDGVEIHRHALETNGIAYLGLGLDIGAVPEHLLSLLPIYCRAILEMGNGLEDYVRFSTRIRRKTGGLSAGPLVVALRGKDRCRGLFMLQGKSTGDKVGDMIGIMADVLRGTDFDDKARLTQIVLEEKAGLEQSLVPYGHAVVLNRLNSWFGEANWLGDRFNGLEYLFYLRSLANRLDSDWPGVLDDLCRLRNVLLNRKNMIVNATMPDSLWDRTVAPLYDLVGSIPEVLSHPREWPGAGPAVSEALIVPSQVNYVGRVLPLDDGGDDNHGAIQVAMNILKTSWLWEQVRVRGGAYGAFCGYDRIMRIMTCGSYRDPNIKRTVEAFAGSAAFLTGRGLPVEELDKAVIGTIGDLDAPKFPDAEGLAATLRYLSGFRDEDRQRTRDQVLAVSMEDLARFGRSMADSDRLAVVSVLGSARAVDQAEAEGLGFERRINLL